MQSTLQAFHNTSLVDCPLQAAFWITFSFYLIISATSVKERMENQSISLLFSQAIGGEKANQTNHTFIIKRKKKYKSWNKMSQYLPYFLRGNMRKFFVNFITRHYSKPTTIMDIREGIQSKITLHKLLLPVFCMYLCMSVIHKRIRAHFLFLSG